jgi:prevent-host-death family protein
MPTAGIRELKDNLSHYIRRVEAGERVAITAHGRIVAEIVPPSAGGVGRPTSRLERLIAAGAAELPTETGDPTRGWPKLHLPRGTAAALVDADRGE